MVTHGHIWSPMVTAMVTLLCDHKKCGHRQGCRTGTDFPYKPSAC